MNIENMIEIQEQQIVPLAKKAYEMSVPVGMGFLQPHETKGLDDNYIAAIQKRIDDNDRMPVAMDYVNGRQCKFDIFRDGDSGKYYIRGSWYDHTENQLKELISGA